MPARPLTRTQLQDARRLAEAFGRWQADRRARGLEASQRYAARQLGFVQSAVSQYLTGRIPLNGEALARFARLLAVAPGRISDRIVRRHRRLSVGLADVEAPSVPSALSASSAPFDQRGSSDAAPALPAWPADLVDRARATAALSSRTVEQQLVHWLRLGAAAELSLTAAQHLALLASAEEPADVPTRLAARHATHEAQVARGERAADSLVVVPRSLAQAARLTFPKDVFGKDRTR